MDESIRGLHNKLTENKIQNSFLELLEEDPLKPIKVIDVCQRANISRGTFYNHYVDIIDLADHINDWYAGVIKPYTARLFKSTESFKEEFKYILAELMDVLSSWPEYSRVILCGESVNGKKAIYKANAMIAKEYEEWLGKFYPEADTKEAMYRFAAALGGGMGILRMWIIGGFEESPEYLIKFFPGVNE